MKQYYTVVETYSQALKGLEWYIKICIKVKVVGYVMSVSNINAKFIKARYVSMSLTCTWKV